FTPYDYVDVMSHHYLKDQEFLQLIIRENVNYIGVLGPRLRTKRLLFGEEIPDWLHSPIGLNLSAKGPEEIAVSIVAEMIKIMRNPVKGSVENQWEVPK